MKNLSALVKIAPLKSLFFILIIISASVVSGFSQDDEQNPLQPFEWIIGGEWHFENAFQVFEWGVGRKSVKSKNFYLINGDTTLVSEGAWFWHPGARSIRGYFTAIMMPVVFFDYETTLEEKKIVSTIKAYSTSNEESVYTEILEQTGDNTCEWSLWQESASGKTKIMGSEFVRRPTKR